MICNTQKDRDDERTGIYQRASDIYPGLNGRSLILIDATDTDELYNHNHTHRPEENRRKPAHSRIGRDRSNPESHQHSERQQLEQVGENLPNGEGSVGGGRH